jgi:hypothetical protein
MPADTPQTWVVCNRSNPLPGEEMPADTPQTWVVCNPMISEATGASKADVSGVCSKMADLPNLNKPLLRTHRKRGVLAKTGSII